MRGVAACRVATRYCQCGIPPPLRRPGSGQEAPQFLGQPVNELGERGHHRRRSCFSHGVITVIFFLLDENVMCGVTKLKPAQGAAYFTVAPPMVSEPTVGAT